MDIQGLRNVAVGFIESMKRPVVAWTISKDSTKFLTALEQVVETDADVMNKLLAAFNAIVTEDKPV